jgi:hypothetical protein
MSAEPSPHRDVAASTFRLDVKGAEVRAALAEAGIRSVLLKGRGLAVLLHDAGDPRNYFDVDLLVAPADARAAHGVLRRLGFVPSYGTGPVDLPRDVLAEGSLHGGVWQRGRDGTSVDLHHSLPQVVADPEAVWRLVSRHTISLPVGGAATETLDAPASALLVALHAAHHGPAGGSPMRDLARATQRLDADCWRQARDLATALGAQDAMGVGLALDPRGRALAGELGLRTEPSVALRLLWGGAPWGSTFIESVLRQPGMRARARLLAGLLVPRPSTMRLSSPLARRSRRGLAAAYAVRPLQLLWRGPAALRSWSRLRRGGGAKDPSNDQGAAVRGRV